MSSSPVGRTHRAAMNENAQVDSAYLQAVKSLWPYEQIARAVIALRMEMGVSQEELARRVGTSASAIARLERGNHKPSVETLRRVAQAMDRELVVEFRKHADTAPGAHLVADRRVRAQSRGASEQGGARRGPRPRPHWGTFDGPKTIAQESVDEEVSPAASRLRS